MSDALLLELVFVLGGVEGSVSSHHFRHPPQLLLVRFHGRDQ